MIGDVAKKLSTSFVRDNVGFLREVLSITTTTTTTTNSNTISDAERIESEPLRNFLTRTDRFNQDIEFGAISHSAS